MLLPHLQPPQLRRPRLLRVSPSHLNLPFFHLHNTTLPTSTTRFLHCFELISSSPQRLRSSVLFPRTHFEGMLLVLQSYPQQREDSRTSISLRFALAILKVKNRSNPPRLLFFSCSPDPRSLLTNHTQVETFSRTAAIMTTARGYKREFTVNGGLMTPDSLASRSASAAPSLLTPKREDTHMSSIDNFQEPRLTRDHLNMHDGIPMYERAGDIPSGMCFIFGFLSHVLTTFQHPLPSLNRGRTQNPRRRPLTRFLAEKALKYLGMMSIDLSA